MNKTTLKKYAKLIVRVGVNLQEGQDVIINASMDQKELVTLIVEEAYLAKARKVKVDWNELPEIYKLMVKYESLETLSEVPNWSVEKLKYQVEKNPARIYVLSDDPDALKGIDQEKVAKMRMARHKVVKPYVDQMNNQYQWTIVAAPSEKWAKKVFPSLSKKEAINKLWDAILLTARVNGDPIKNWENHNQDLLSRCNYLNSFDFDYLEYKASNGTDFKVWMLDKCQWLGGGETSLRGIYYNPNMPTEECFTTPIKGKAEGVVYATKPLSYNGELIENFSFTFKDGKVVSFHAEKGEELLRHMLSMDDSASYLGECALVPFSSPVNETGILFYNTLFDENATCHLALGAGFSDCVKNYENYTKNDFDEMGINDSIIHVDFMIGTIDLNITGVTKDGQRVALFRNGTWAF